ncbi:hypothetical protein [Corynebacterium efficiens YS-314]|uniref:Uncharacterized protein n=1 Tax=Corynebacterium efficiens (strain DSM 44549 / YS-314 / AJ 12310 / JCM 11189 / NBRC 100395) TaxID=196164 RepID=Q8FSP8_COREF|nr:hypothetical protein [Corynebacterium efficiens YS-314]
MWRGRFSGTWWVEVDDFDTWAGQRGGCVEKIETEWAVGLKKSTHPGLPAQGVSKKSKGAG